MAPPQPPNGAAGVEIRGAAVSSCLVRPALASSTRPPSSMEPSIPQRTRSESRPLLLHSPPLSSSPLPSMEQPHPQSRVMLPASFGYHPAPSSAMNWNAIHLVPSSSSSFDSVPFSTATRPVAAFSDGAQVAAISSPFLVQATKSASAVHSSNSSIPLQCFPPYYFASNQHHFVAQGHTSMTELLLRQAQTPALPPFLSVPTVSSSFNQMVPGVSSHVASGSSDDNTPSRPILPVSVPPAPSLPVQGVSVPPKFVSNTTVQCGNNQPVRHLQKRPRVKKVSSGCVVEPGYITSDEDNSSDVCGSAADDAETVQSFPIVATDLIDLTVQMLSMIQTLNTMQNLDQSYHALKSAVTKLPDQLLVLGSMEVPRSPARNISSPASLQLIRQGVSQEVQIQVRCMLVSVSNGHSEESKQWCKGIQTV